MENKKQTFKLKQTITGHYMSEVDFEYIFKNEHSGSRGIGGERAIPFSKQMRNYCQYFREEVSDEDKKKILVVSNISEPLTFYFDKPYLKCSKTHKYVCSTELKWECGGGSYLFLSYSKNCAIEFPDVKSGFLHYTKSLVYPGRGMPDYALHPDQLKYHFNREYNGGGHILVNYKISENINTIVAYHNTNYKSKYGLTQEFITDNNNKEIFVVPENHDHKALKMPLEQAIKETGEAHYKLAKKHGENPHFRNRLTEERCQEYANIAMEKRRNQG
jgi:hypothetical protein